MPASAPSSASVRTRPSDAVLGRDVRGLERRRGERVRGRDDLEARVAARREVRPRVLGEQERAREQQRDQPVPRRPRGSRRSARRAGRPRWRRRRRGGRSARPPRRPRRGWPRGRAGRRRTASPGPSSSGVEVDGEHVVAGRLERRGDRPPDAAGRARDQRDAARARRALHDAERCVTTPDARSMRAKRELGSGRRLRISTKTRRRTSRFPALNAPPERHLAFRRGGSTPARGPRRRRRSWLSPSHEGDGPALLEVRDLGVSYAGALRALRGVSTVGAARARSSRCSAPTAPGKSTLLRAISGHAAAAERRRRRGRRSVRGPRHPRRRPGRHRPRRHRPGPRGPAHLRRADRRGEPARRRDDRARAATRAGARSERVFELFPRLARAPPPARRAAVRRRAADARDRARADERAEAAAARRAVARPRAEGRRADRRGHPRDQPPGHVGRPRRAERRDGARRRRDRVRARGRRGHARTARPRSSRRAPRSSSATSAARRAPPTSHAAADEAAAPRNAAPGRAARRREPDRPLRRHHRDRGRVVHRRAAAPCTRSSGPNGAGKSTTLNVLTGVYEPTEGSVRYGDRDAAPACARTASPRWASAARSRTSRCRRPRPCEDNLLLGRHRLTKAGFVGAGLGLPSARRERARAGRARARDRRRCSSSRSCSTAPSPGCPTATASASSWRARCAPSRRCCCSTSRWRA